MDPSTVSSLPELRVLVALADGKTLAQAGADLFVSQPTASKLLQALERRVGLRLAERRGRRLVLTAAGADIAARARALLAGVHDLERAMERARAGESGLLRVLATHTPGNYVLPCRLATFHRAHPGVQIALSIVPNQEFWTLLLDGSHELGVVPSPLEPVPRWLAAVPLYDDPLVFFAAARGRFDRPGPVLPADLDETTIVAPFSLSYWDRALAHMGTLGVSFRRRIDLAFPEAVKRLVAGGDYVGIHYGSVIEEEVKNGALVPLQVHGVALSQAYYLVHRRPPSLLPVAQLFRDALLAEMTAPRQQDRTYTVS